MSKINLSGYLISTLLLDLFKCIIVATKTSVCHVSSPLYHPKPNTDILDTYRQYIDDDQIQSDIQGVLCGNVLWYDRLLCGILGTILLL